jgi:peptidyl-prolyl cis-trans isomerase SurA
MRRSLTLLAALACAAGAPAALRAQEPAAVPAGQRVPVDRVVAVVGSEPVLLSDIEGRLAEVVAQMRARNQTVPQDSAGLAAMRQQLLTTVINEELLVQYAKAQKVEVTDAEIADAVDRYVARVRQQYPTEEEYRADLRRSGFGSPEEFRRWYTEQERRREYQSKLVAKLRQDGKLPPAPITDEDIRKYFEANREQIPRMPATVAFRQVIITPKASPAAKEATRAKAESLLTEIRRGADFAAVAKRESEDGSKDVGGDLGWRRRGEFVPEFERVMLSLAPGQVSPVFESPFGYHIMKLDRVQAGEFKVRHILLRPTIDSLDVARARAEADTAARQWREGMPYDSLVARHHDRAEDRIIPELPKAQLPQAYQDAVAGEQANAVVGPFPIEDRSRGVPKFVVLQLTQVGEEHEPTLADYREQIRAQLQQERAFLRLIENLKKEMYVSVRM